MKRKVKRWIAMLLALAMSVGLLSSNAWAATEVASGSCGNNVVWKLDSEGLLTISGNGELLPTDFIEIYNGTIGDMVEYGIYPWNDYKELINRVNISFGITKIGQEAFWRCSELSSVTIPSSVTIIGEGAFRGCVSLSDCILPSSVTSIGPCCFYDCASLESITLPHTQNWIGDYTFYNCKSLKEITIPNSVTSIGSYAFSGCYNLSSVTMSNKLEAIGVKVFSECNSLLEIYLPRTFREFSWPGEGSFGAERTFYCNNLKRIIVSEENEKYSDLDGVLFNNEKTLLLLYPPGKDETEFIIPSTVTRVGENTGDSLSRPFRNCKNLDRIFFTGDAPSFCKDAFLNTNVVVYYPINNNTWTSDMMQDYGGTITWKSWNPGGESEKINLSTCTATLSQTSYTYDGTAKNPTLTVKNASGNKLAEGTDYTVSVPSGRTEVGTYTYTITGTGNYTGSKQVSFTINQGDSNTLCLEDLSYSFSNSRNAFGYPIDYNIPLSSFQIIFGETTKAKSMYSSKSKGRTWGGNCAGFSGTSALMVDPGSGIGVKNFNISANRIRDLNVNDKGSANISVTTFIEALQIAQYTQLFQNELKSHLVYTQPSLQDKSGNLNYLYQAVKEQTAAGKPVVITVFQDGGHAVLAYGVDDVSNTESHILLYDNNYPSQERQMTLKKDSSGNWMEWSYEMGWSYGVWGSDNSNSYISYVPYSIVQRIWKTRGNLEENENVLIINSQDVDIYDANDRRVATVLNGTLTTSDNKISQIEDLTLEPNENDDLLLAVPVDMYTITNRDKNVKDFRVGMVNTALGATVSTSANEVTLAVDDSCNLNAVYIDATKDDTYSVTLNSCLKEDNDDVVVTGKGSDELLEISQTKGSITINNCQVISVTVDGKPTNVITSDAGTGGSISPMGETITVQGKSQAYKITPKSGYAIKSVTVDGKNVGAVSSYTFKNIQADHTIRAEFKINPKALVASNVTLSPTSYTYNGSAKKPSVTVKDGTKTLTTNTDYTVTYAAGRINTGTYSVNVTGKGNYIGTISKTFTIKPKALTAANVTLSTTSYTYNGSAKKPGVTVKDGTKTLTANTDYTVSYAAGRINAGTYKVTVTGKGNYSGTVSKNFTIKAKAITPTVTLSKTAFVYNGKVQKPTVTVKDGTTKLTTANYTVTWPSGCKAVGTYKVTVRLKGNYSGSKAVSYKINPKATTMTKVTAASKGFTAAWTKQATQTTGYQIQYSLSSTFASGNKAVLVKKNTTLSQKVKGLKAKKKYYVRVRTYKTVGSTMYYSAWSKALAVTTKA